MAQWAHYSTPDEEFVKLKAERPPIAPPVVKDAKEGDEEIIKRQKIVEELMRKAVEVAGPRQYITLLPRVN